MYLFYTLIANFVFYKDSHHLVLNPGQYRISCFGAQGGDGYSNGKPSSKGGKGAYVSGTMMFGGTKKNFYAYVGGKGSSSKKGPNAGGFNGGGAGGKDTTLFGGDDASGGGGGATDFRIDDTNLDNRIIVAAGGSGGANACEGAPGGDLTGYEPTANNYYISSSKVDQNNGNIDGVGGIGVNSMNVPGSGGGGGWRGGITSNDWSSMGDHSYMSVAQSGSSYISGHVGCKKNVKISFKDRVMISGYQSGGGKIEIEVFYECTLVDHSCKKDFKLLKCFDGFFEHGDMCVSSCPSGFVEINKKCTKCSEQCATCQNSTSSCTSCLNGYLYNNQCVSECPKGTLNIGKACTICKSQNGNCNPINLIKENQQITLKPGRYRVKCYGAQGGQSFNFSTPFKHGGKGAYVSGIMDVKGQETTFYANIGKAGESGTNEGSLGGSGGGGNSGKCLGTNCTNSISSSGGGGGATDLRIHDNSTINRIIVASGGSGAAFSCEGAPGGELTGMIAVSNNNFIEVGRINPNPRDPIEAGRDGFDSEHIPQSGGGGGYYGGLTSNQIGQYENESWKSVSESGNSYLSGYVGCENHQFMTFEEGEMIGGYNEGDGKIEIETEFLCPFNCYSCISQTKCTKCISNYFLFNEGSECVLKCPVDYSEYNGECVKCSSPCDTCSSTPTACTSCIENYNLYQNQCISSCPTGTYSTGIMPAGFECRTCQSPCLTCELAVDYCTSCIEGYFLLEHDCVEICPEGTATISNKCVLCDFPCSKCKGTTNNCYECKLGYYLSGSSCVLKCPTGTTQSSMACIPCESENGCTSSITYITKMQKFTLRSGVYKVECVGGGGGPYTHDYRSGGNGAYASGIMRIDGEGTVFYSNVGKEGNYSYKEAPNGGAGGGGYGGKYSGSEDDDTKSSSGGGGASDLRILDNTTRNRIIVAAGGSGAVRGCEGAPGGTLTGMYSTSNNHFQASPLVDQISGVYSGHGQSGYSSDSIPQSGAGGGYRGGVRSNGYGSNTGECWKSVAHSGSSYISGYTGCSKNRYMAFTDGVMKAGYNIGNGHISITAQFECTFKCHTCTNKTICTKCFDNYLLYKNRCVDSCPPDSVQNNEICELCSSSCLTCKSSVTTCTSCKDGFYFYSNQCLQKCPEGYVGLNRICEKCTEPCSSCTISQSICTSCSEKLYLYEGQCLPDCPKGFFGKNGLCQNCISPCKECTSEFACLTCNENYYYYENKCLRSCPDGYIGVNQKCEKCKSPCNTCIFAQDICTSCDPNYYLYQTKCWSSCPNGTVEVDQICEECILPCKTCESSRDKCETCIDGFYLDGDKCFKCDDTCRTCSITKNHCESCWKDKFLLMNNCMMDCEGINQTEEEYIGKDLENNECRKCSVRNCIECSNDYLICTECREYYYLEENKCIRETTTGFTNSKMFSDSQIFTKSLMFSESEKFTQTSIFSISSLFTMSMNFIQSSEFTHSNFFTSSCGFSHSSHFTETSEFTNTLLFSLSLIFTQSSNFTISLNFKPSFPFSSSFVFTHTQFFSETSIFSQTFQFTASLVFTCSSEFTKPFSHSSLFSSSSQFSESFYFTKSEEFTSSFEKLPNNIDFRQSQLFELSSSLLNLASIIFNSPVFGSQTNAKNSDGSERPAIEMTQSKEKGNKTPMIVGVSVGVLLIVAAAIITIMLILKKKKKEDLSVKIDDNKQEKDSITNDETSSIIQDKEEIERELDFWL